MDLRARVEQTVALLLRRNRKEDRVGQGRMAFTGLGTKAERMRKIEKVRFGEGS